MDFSGLITLDRIVCDPDIHSKKRVLEELSELMADSAHQKSTDIFDKLIDRERLGSTGLGRGIALPHGRLGQSDHIIAAFIKLPEAIPFESADGEPVDLLFALLIPEAKNNEHLQTLAAIAKFFQDESNTALLRKAESAEAIYRILQNNFLTKQAS